MTFQRHAKKFMTALGMTPNAIDCEQTYDNIIREGDLQDGVLSTAQEMLKILGYQADNTRITFRDKATVEAMCRLIGAQIGEQLHEREVDILHYLAKTAADHLPPGEDYNPKTIVSEVISEHCDQFQALMADIVEHKKKRGHEHERSYALQKLSATEAIIAARQLAAIYKIPMGEHPHPALAILMPHVEKQELAENARCSRAA
jgi:hypothetical protein